MAEPTRPIKPAQRARKGRTAKIDWRTIPSAMEQLAESWRRSDAD